MMRLVGGLKATVLPLLSVAAAAFLASCTNVPSASDEFAFHQTFGQQPDPAKWAAETWSPRADHHWIAPDSSGNGILHLKSDCTNGHPWYQGDPYSNCNTSSDQLWNPGGIKSKVTLTPPFYIGVSAKVSDMSTSWNAPLWLMSPCVEIDVGEQLGRLPTTNWNVIHNWCQNNRQFDISRDCGIVFANGYHVYSAYVTTTKAEFRVDKSACTSTISAKDVGLGDFGGGFTVHIDELRGCGYWPGCQANPPPAVMLVDYVRTFRP
jgi:Glycosyl hydrolases family 16